MLIPPITYLRSVSIHVPARGTTEYTFGNAFYIKVSIHVPARGTTLRDGKIDKSELVSIHVPARGTTKLILIIPLFIKVSIHVPARGTTLDDGDVLVIDTVSIHVPARGTTRRSGAESRAFGFQSTFPQGERRYDTGENTVTSSVSIHVPARGTTETNRSILLRTYCFNPRSRKGNDAGEKGITGAESMFQSTFPQGERQRLLYGSDSIRLVSIHVPARGTTGRSAIHCELC